MEDDLKTSGARLADDADKPHSDKGGIAAKFVEKFREQADPDLGRAARMKHDPDATVIHLNGEVLSRPLDMPARVRGGLVIALVIAALIGAAFLSWYFDGIVNEPKRQQQAISESLSKEVSYDLPNLYSLMPLDDASILATLQQTGLNIYEAPMREGSSLYEIIKLPADVSAVDAGAMYLAGVENLQASDAARLLNGSWNLQVDRENGVNMVLHYADFKSGNVDAAVQSALAFEGLTDSSIEDSGEDSAGNTYVLGTISGDGGTFSWRVSALPLSEVYSISGLPSNAVYVGIRMTS